MSATKEDICRTTARDAELSKPSVKNRLALHYQYWERTLCAPFFVLNIIKNGYILPFRTTPTRFFAKNNQSSLRHHDFAESEIENCLKKSYITETDHIPFCCNPLTVAENNKKLRLVLDLRHVNPHLKKSKFRYEDLDTVTDILQPNDFFTTFDLVSAYYHINIHPDYHKFLGFHWKFRDGSTRYFQYTVLVFGLSTACYVFTKIMRPLITHWRLKGFKILFYLDDGFNMAQGHPLCDQSTRTVTQCLESAGFLVNYEKSELDPKQTGEWLGFEINSQEMTFVVPQRKIDKLKQCLADLCAHGFASYRSLSKITGTLSSMERALGPLVSLMTRFTNLEIASRLSPDKVSRISQDCHQELQFWYKNIVSNNGYSIKRNHPTSQIIFCDASDNAYGGFMLHRLGKPICQSRFSHDELGTSSTYRELLAIKNCLLSFAGHIQHEAVEVRTDNKNAAGIIQKGSRRPHLQQLAVEIFEICLKYDILIKPTWIPREQNRYADYLSKLSDTDDWTIDNETFQYLVQEFGQPQFDRFSDNLNYKVPHFNSLYHCPNTSGINAFAHDWSNVSLNWLCPPIKLISSTLRHMRLCQARGILLVPQWPSSYFWPLLHNGTSFAYFIKDYRIIDPYYYSSSEKCQFKGFLSFHAIAFLIDFATPGSVPIVSSTTSATS